MALLKRSEVCERLGICRSTLDKIRKRSRIRFPSPIMTEFGMRWREEAIEAYIDRMARAGRKRVRHSQRDKLGRFMPERKAS